MIEGHADRPIARGSVLDWSWDWTAWLLAGDSITGQTVEVTPMLTAAAPSAEGAVVTAVITCQDDAPIALRQHATCTITTAGGLVDSRTIRFVVVG